MLLDTHIVKGLKTQIVFVYMLLCSLSAIAQHCVPDYSTGPNGGCKGLFDPKDINDFILIGSGKDHIIDTATRCYSQSHDDRTALFAPVQMIQGQSYYGSITSRGTKGRIKMWIDFNNDGIFQPSDSVSALIQVVADHPYEFTVGIPRTADTGLHRMRVRISTATSIASIDPCAFQNSGESHDYWVRVLKAEANDLSAYKIIDPTTSSMVCSGRPTTIKAVIKNLGTNPQSGFNVRVQYSGAATGSVQNIYSNTLAPYAQDTFSITFTPPVAGSYALKAYTALNTDIRIANDSTISMAIVDQSPQKVLMDTAVCIQNLPIILDAGNTGCTYLWNSLSNDQAISVPHAGIYFVKITSPSGCVTMDTATVKNYPVATVAGINITGSGSKFIFKAGGVKNVTEYTWDFGDGHTANTDTAEHRYSAAGTYTVKLIVANQCSTDTATFDVIVFTTDVAITAIESDDILLYPNPANGFIYIDPVRNIMAMELLVVDSRGVVVHEIKPGLLGGKYKLELGSLATGNYILVMRSDKGNCYKMFCIGR